MLRKIMFVPKDYKERFGDKQFVIPENYGFYPNICYADNGDLVIFEYGQPFWIKVGRLRFARVVCHESSFNTSTER